MAVLYDTIASFGIYTQSYDYVYMIVQCVLYNAQESVCTCMVCKIYNTRVSIILYIIHAQSASC